MFVNRARYKTSGVTECVAGVVEVGVYDVQLHTHFLVGQVHKKLWKCQSKSFYTSNICKLELSFYYSSEELARRLQEEENSQAQEQPQQPHQPQRGEAAGAAATPAAPSTSRGTAGGSPGRNQSGASSSTQRTKNVTTFFPLQVNNYEIVIKNFHISHNLAWYSVIVHKFTRISKVC